MKKKILSVVMMVFMTTVMQAQRGGHIETTRSRHEIAHRRSKYGRTGGIQLEILHSDDGHSWYYTYDMNGRKRHTFSVSAVGEVLSVSGDTFTSRKGSWIYTWTKEDRKINTRPAK